MRSIPDSVSVSSTVGNAEPKVQTPPLPTAVLRAGSWTVLADLVGNAARFVGTFVVARALGPDDFAVWPVLAVFVALGVALDHAGLHTALLSRGSWTEPQASAGFWLSAMTGTALALALPAIGFVLRPDAQLVPYLVVIGVTHVTSTIALIPQVSLAAQLAFRRLSVVDVTSRFLGAVTTLALVLTWRSIWVLVIGTIVQRVLLHVWLARLVKPRVSFPPSVRAFRPFASFAIASYATALLGFVSAQLGTIVVAALLSDAETGIWGLATLVLVTAQSTVAGAAAKVLLPTLNHVAQDRKGKVFLRSVSLVTAVVVGVAGVSTLVVPWTVEYLLDDGWSRLTIVAILLLPAAFARGLGPLTDAFLYAHGSAASTLRWELLRLPLSAFSAITLTAFFGLYGAALATAPLLVASVVFRARALKVCGVRASTLLRRLAAPVCVAVLASALPASALILGGPTHLITGSAAVMFLAAYVTGLAVFVPGLLGDVRRVVGKT